MCLQAGRSGCTHLLGVAFISSLLAMAAVTSSGLVDCLSLDPEATCAVRRPGIKILKKDFRDFMELVSRDGREWRGRGEKERGTGLSSWKWGAGSTAAAIWWTSRGKKSEISN